MLFKILKSSNLDIKSMILNRMLDVWLDGQIKTLCNKND